MQGLGEVIQAKIGKKEQSASITHQRVSRTLDKLKGQRVIGRNIIDGFYYPGIAID